jgi:hypothetical protein
MPAFIKTPADEKRWAKAKEAANKSHSESEGDSYWAIVNSIYQKMVKSIVDAEQVSDPTYIDAMINILSKARQRMSDEEPDYHDENDDESNTDYEFNPDEEPQDEGEDWLKENDPEHNEDESSLEEPVKEEKAKVSRFRQPSKEELLEMRKYTRPLEQRGKDIQRLEADPSKNPVLAHQGHLVEARSTGHGDYKKAYQEFMGSPEYQKADRKSKMKMDLQFKKDWKEKNPEHLTNAIQAHDEAHKRGLEGHSKHDAAKQSRIEDITSGGAQSPDAYSTEAGLQHAGGTKGEEGTEGTIIHSPAASFARNNPDLIRQIKEKRDQEGKSGSNADEHEYESKPERNIQEILGPAATNDPKFQKFFEHYHPLVDMNKKKAIASLGLDPQSPDIDHGLLREAGMHGLFQAINDYDHDHPSKASFATHASNKIRGLQMSAMKSQDVIPTEIRQAQKQFEAKQHAPKVAPIAPQIAESSIKPHPSHPQAADIIDRLKRVGSAKATHIKRRTGAEAQVKPIKEAIKIPEIESVDEGEE